MICAREHGGVSVLNVRPESTTVGIIVARADSSRLPGKALALVGGRPLLGYVIERAKRVEGLHSLVLATTDRAVDDELADFADVAGIGVFRGATDDVAGRLLDCADIAGADYFARINGDSPFLDPALLSAGIELVAPGIDLVTSVIGRTYPYGVSVEIVRSDAMRDAHPRMSAEDREHVTAYFYNHAEEFGIRELRSEHPELAAARMVVDTPEDLSAFGTVVGELGDEALTAGYTRAAPLYIRIGHVR